MSGHDPGIAMQQSMTLASDPIFSNFVVGAGSLIAGNTYTIEIEFNIFTAIDGSSLSGATGVALYENRTVIQVLAVPEPSTYALIGGLIALAGVVWNRRRCSRA